jgi:hypothetical protein
MTSSLKPIRRVVTYDDAQGRSHILEDGPSPAVRVVRQRPGYRVTNLWRTQASPSPIVAPDSISDHTGVSPPPGGTVLRIIDIPPEPSDPQELQRAMEANRASFGNGTDWGPPVWDGTKDLTTLAAPPGAVFFMPKWKTGHS